MSAIVDSLQFKPGGGPPARWLLVRNASGVFSWTRDESIATRFSDEQAAALISRDRRSDLPPLPTTPEPILPTFLRAVHGTAEEPPPPPAFVITPEPPPTLEGSASPLPTPPQKPKKPRPERHHPSPSEVFENLDKRHLA